MVWCTWDFWYKMNLYQTLYVKTTIFRPHMKILLLLLWKMYHSRDNLNQQRVLRVKIERSERAYNQDEYIFNYWFLIISINKNGTNK